MAPRGRKPKPTYLKLVTNTPRKHRSPNNEPTPERAIPSMPPELSDDAKAEWALVSADLHRLGLLTRIDRAVLSAYCASCGRWTSAERELRKLDASALLVKTKLGNVIQHPLIGVANKAAHDMVRYATELGMTPSARARISVPAPADGDPASKYFTRG
jgi:P27 family predicted phage terminase small subunit